MVSVIYLGVDRYTTAMLKHILTLIFIVVRNRAVLVQRMQLYGFLLLLLDLQVLW